MMFKWIYLINHNSLDMGIRITYKTFFSCIENNENQENGNKKGNSRVKLQFKQYKSIKWKYKVKKTTQHALHFVFNVSNTKSKE